MEIKTFYLFRWKSKQLYFLHDAQELVFVDLTVSFDIGHLDHLADHVVFDAEETLLCHFLHFLGV